MRRVAGWLLAALAGAGLAHALVVYSVPWLIMAIAMRGMTRQNGTNHAAFPPRADESSRAIVRPSPDLLYSACVFDVSQGPLRVTAQVPPQTYWSLSMFAANTDNFYKQNDHEAVDGQVDIVLVREGSNAPVPKGATVVEAPTSQGIILTRTLINEESRLAELDTARRSFVCAPM